MVYKGSFKRREKIMMSHGKITSLKRLKNTYMGNPHFEVVFVLDDGTTIWGKTAPTLAYRLDYYNEGNQGKMEYHSTPSGRIKFTDWQQDK